MATAPTLIIGVGNRYRGDDAVGLAAAERLKQLHLPGIAVRFCPGGGLGLLEAWQGADTVIIIDAVRGAGVAGEIVRLDHQDLDRLDGSGKVSSHGFGLGEVVRLAQALELMPARVMIYGVEARNFEPGTALSPEVAAAVDQVALLVAQEFKCTSLNARVWPGQRYNPSSPSGS
jgi:hydrogenase maturation protease